MVVGSLERPLTGHKEGGGVGGCHRGLGAGPWTKNLEEANLTLEDVKETAKYISALVKSFLSSLK